MTRSVTVNSARARQAGASLTSTWVSEWLPTACPSLTSRAMISGWLAIILPVAKKVAGTWAFDRTSSNSGVYFGSGPSSNVSEIVLFAVAEYPNLWMTY